MQKMPSMPSGRKRPSASKLRRSENNNGAGTLCLILVFVSLVTFTLSARQGQTGFIEGTRGVVQTIVSPLRTLGAGIVSPFAGLSNVMRNLTADEKTLSELKADNERLSARNVELEEAEQTAKRLQGLLDLKSSYNLQSTGARVIAGSTDSWAQTVTIDKGSADGISVGMPVVDENGAIGQIITCSAKTSVVRLLSDEGSSVSAMLQTSRAQGMLEGSVDAALQLCFIRTDQTVNVGDIVVTSGLGGVFPKGLPLGKVQSIENAPGAAYYDIVVEPYARAENLEEVLVVTSLTEEQQASAEDIETADAADLTALEYAGTADDAAQDGSADSASADGADVADQGLWTEADGTDAADTAYVQDGSTATGYGEDATGAGTDAAAW